MFTDQSFTAALSGSGVRSCPELFQELDAAYGAADRHYHDRRHIADCLASLERNRDLAVRPDEISLAIWFHDAVYDTRRGDNEECSAELAAARLREAGADEALAARVRALILATKHDAKKSPGEGPGEPVAPADLDLLVDIDLEILGRPAAAFDEYDAAIRREYQWVPEAAYRAARIVVLRGFLARERIYRTGRFAERYEKTARENLSRALAALEAA